MKQKRNMMKKIIFYATLLAIATACKNNVCDYDSKINDIYITGWHGGVPSKGCIYTYDRHTSFKQAKDSMKIHNITKDGEGLPVLLCSLKDGNFNYNTDMRLILDDTLIYDITDIRLEWFVDKRHWVMGGPWEHCIVSSLKVNGHHVTCKTTVSELGFPHKYARRNKRTVDD